MNVIDICKKIDVPQEMMGFVSKKLAPWEVLQSLTNISTAHNGYIQLKELLGNDDNGLKMFACMLNAATITYEKYLRFGINEKIFIDTMYCFTRFVKEHYNNYGICGFDRGWWAYRQLSCVLFKIGELEYEYRDDENTIQLHIPSGANISIENCKKSLNEFHAFTAQYFPKKEYPIVCNSWLLSPALDELLPPQTNIMRFKHCFDIVCWNKTDTEFLHWVYGKTNIDFDKLPEQTSLQINMKKHLINGECIGSAFGRLIDFV